MLVRWVSLQSISREHQENSKRFSVPMEAHANMLADARTPLAMDKNRTDTRSARFSRTQVRSGGGPEHVDHRSGRAID